MFPAVCILGRFPPPIDGQSMLTEQMARLLEKSRTVHRININTASAGDTTVRTHTRLHRGLLRDFYSSMKNTRQALAEVPDAPVVWHSISPMPLGHIRDLLAIMPAFRPGQKIYSVIHWGNFERLFRSPVTNLTARLLVRRLSGFIFLDESLSQKCAEWIPVEKRFTICNSIDGATQCTPAEVATKQANRVDRKLLRVLYLSNMIGSKGYLDVLHAVAMLHAEGFPIAADFIGRWQSDEDQTAFMNFVAAHNLDTVVTSHGGISDRGRIKQFFLDADVFSLPTYYQTEAQPLSILEAINAGTPVVTTRHASIPNMVREDSNEALFVPPRSPAAIAEAFRKLSDTKRWLIFSKAAALRFTNQFSPDAVCEKWEALLAR